MTPAEARPSWWSPGVGGREVMRSLAATHGPLPAAVATRLGEGRDPVSLLRPHSPDPRAVAEALDGLGVRLLLPGDDGWPLAATPPDPPCAWLFVAGPAPPGAAASVAVVGGRRASPLRRAAASALGSGLARVGWCVVSGGAVGVDAAAHAGALDAGGRTVVVLGCGHDVPYPRANTGLFARVLAAGGTVVSEHPPGSRPRAANFLPRNRLIAALSAAVVVVEATEDSGSLSTARAAGSRGSGRVLVLPGAPWDPGAAGCNQLIRDGATLVRSLTDILEELSTVTTPTTHDPPLTESTPTTTDGPGPGVLAIGAPTGRGLGGSAPTTADGRPADVPSAGPSSRQGPGGPAVGAVDGPGGPWPGLDAAARAVLAALVDGQILGPGRLAIATGLRPAVLDAALLDLELTGLIRRTAAGVQATALPPGLAAATRRALGAADRAGSDLEPRGPPRPPLVRGSPPPEPGRGPEVLECGGAAGDDGRDG